MRRAKAKPESGVRQVTRAELAALWNARGSGLTDTQLKATRVPLGDLKVAPNVYTIRDGNQRPSEKRQHVARLVEQIQLRGGLEPVEVFAVDGVRWVVAGHCRVAAYQRVHSKDSLVLVKHLRGTFDEALRRAVRANAGERLPLTTQERLEGAWRLCVHDSTEHCYIPIPNEIAKDAGVAVLTVRRMKDAIARDPSLAALTWAEASRKLDGQPEQIDAQELEDTLVTQWAERLSNQFGEAPTYQSAAFLMALDDAWPDFREQRFTLERAEFIRWLECEGYTVSKH